ncbi:hypothetical protein OPQ81_003927 [Rhizoctonia solani]|nr:hypothetical protein OPQ81_003927 [Rhizoctonia solani]
MSNAIPTPTLGLDPTVRTLQSGEPLSFHPPTSDIAVAMMGMGFNHLMGILQGTIDLSVRAYTRNPSAPAEPKLVQTKPGAIAAPGPPAYSEPPPGSGAINRNFATDKFDHTHTHYEHCTREQQPTGGVKSKEPPRATRRAAEWLGRANVSSA